MIPLPRHLLYPFSHSTPSLYIYCPSPSPSRLSLVTSSSSLSLSQSNFLDSVLLCFPSMASPTLFSSTESAPPFYFDEKWKLSKKEASSRSRSSISSSSSSFMKNSTTTQRRCAFARKCARLVKEQRARFYIMRRCVIMLICWRDYSDS